MTTLFTQPEETVLQAEHRGQQRLHPDSSLSFSVSLNADRRRIFQMLTIAEYMETWLSVPGCHSDSPIHVVSDPAGFYIQYLDERGDSSTLIGLYQTYRTSKTNFLLRRTGCRESDTSVVRIRLNGDFERTTLCLHHGGLSTAEERDWHSQLWTLSLKKLSSLFELQYWSGWQI